MATSGFGAFFGLPLVETSAPAVDVPLALLPGLACAVERRGGGGEYFWICGPPRCRNGGVLFALEGGTMFGGSQEVMFILVDFGVGEIFESLHGEKGGTKRSESLGAVEETNDFEGSGFRCPSLSRGVGEDAHAARLACRILTSHSVRAGTSVQQPIKRF
jgi:hypothetical protein